MDDSEDIDEAEEEEEKDEENEADDNESKEEAFKDYDLDKIIRELVEEN